MAPIHHFQLGGGRNAGGDAFWVVGLPAALAGGLAVRVMADYASVHLGALGWGQVAVIGF
jgi:hypothetical protein